MKQALATLLLALIFIGCEINAPDPAPLLPILTTVPTTSITATTALSGGDVSTGVGPAINARGVCWGTAHNPDVTGNHTTNGSGSGTFTSPITGLTANTTYYVRAYAINSVGTGYGNEISFTTTTSTTALPTVTTTAVTAINMTTAAGGGNIIADGGAAITARGVCWGTAANPDITLSTKTTDGTGIGNFASAITGLTAGTTYHVRAYATNSVGTAYGSDVSFTTTTITTPDVYVAGSIGNAAVLWKNGVVTYLTDGSHRASANSVFVFGTDVYVAGYENSTWGDIAYVWKNGVPIKLDGGLYPNGASYDARGNSVFVSGTNEYVAGAEQVPFPNDLAAMFWKNHSGTNITTSGTTTAAAHSVFVLGTDVYVAGEEQVSGSYVAKVWKNNVATTLSNAFSDANSVFTSGTDVYVAGRDRVLLAPGSMPDLPTVWKNGVATYLSNVSGEAKTVFVYGTDVYVAGNEYNVTVGVAKIWKNGVATSLTNGSTNAYAVSVFVK
jgi:hypothetical protein